MSIRRSFWNRMYRREPTWDLGRPEPDLLRALDAHGLSGPGRALDVGCGTGDNAVALAQHGYEVTAIDLAGRALDRARAKAEAAGVGIDLRLEALDDLEEPDGTFELIVDRGLLMSLFGEGARRRYAAEVTRLVAEGGRVFQHQWVLPEPPRPPSPPWMATTLHALVLAPEELEQRFGPAFEIELLQRLIEPADDPGIRRLGIHQVAKTSYLLTRRPDRKPEVTHA